MKSPQNAQKNSWNHLTLSNQLHNTLPELKSFFENFSEKEKKYLQSMYENSDNFRNHPLVIMRSFLFPEWTKTNSTYIDFWNYKIEILAKNFEEQFWNPILSHEKNPEKIQNFINFFLNEINIILKRTFSIQEKTSEKIWKILQND